MKIVLFYEKTYINLESASSRLCFFNVVSGEGCVIILHREKFTCREALIVTNP